MWSFFQRVLLLADLYNARRLWLQCRTRFHLETRRASEDFRHNCNCLSKKKKKIALSSFGGVAIRSRVVNLCLILPPHDRLSYCCSYKKGPKHPKKVVSFSALRENSKFCLFFLYFYGLENKRRFVVFKDDVKKFYKD